MTHHIPSYLILCLAIDGSSWSKDKAYPYNIYNEDVIVIQEKWMVLFVISTDFMTAERVPYIYYPTLIFLPQFIKNSYYCHVAMKKRNVENGNQRKRK